ncbi:hypothetical protein CYMTET_54671 [Cymbomonas tetramitiformis]|uniref:Uncharacterized protein n=1 Tax=Cymbomonas tetramitiformis TaxID=36881 RepID=A0AAE0EP43_9CHLO|nr:hypothetical protein CYMTET_54671 [Cymbomonas tetramitiformis]
MSTGRLSRVRKPTAKAKAVSAGRDGGTAGDATPVASDAQATAKSPKLTIKIGAPKPAQQVVALMLQYVTTSKQKEKKDLEAQNHKFGPLWKVEMMGRYLIQLLNY